MRRSEQPRPMLQALQQLSCDGRLKAVAFRFLQGDLSKLRSEADFRKAYHGLLVTQQLLGPLDVNYRRTLDDMRKALDSYGTEAQIMEDVNDAVSRIWEGILGILQVSVPSEHWKNVCEKITSTLKRARS